MSTTDTPPLTAKRPSGYGDILIASLTIDLYLSEAHANRADAADDELGQPEVLAELSRKITAEVKNLPAVQDAARVATRVADRFLGSKLKTAGVVATVRD